MFRVAVWLAAIPALAAGTAALAGSDDFRLTGRVVDRAQVLDKATRDHVTAASRRLEQRTGHQLVVVTIPSLEGDTIEHYSLTLFNRWRVGRACCNDGVGLLFAMRERRVRVEVGKGLERQLTDPEAAAIIQRSILPAIARGGIAAGVRAGTDAIAGELERS